YYRLNLMTTIDLSCIENQLKIYSCVRFMTQINFAGLDCEKNQNDHAGSDATCGAGGI
ncbi:MAG: hypothetical protein ACI9DH_000224, partial [Halioglobus sp.]